MESKRCYGCMKLKTQTPLCEHCGYNEYIDNLSHQLPLGTILQGRYEVGKVLGQGGFGITYIGWDHAREATVAVKEFYPNGIVNRDASVSMALKVNSADSAEAFERNRRRFLQEAYVLKKLNDIPQIVHVENLFEENNTAYIVMEYIRGIDLRRYIRMAGGRLSVSKTLDILCPVMEALQKAHEAGLVHRDVSPDNIMLMPDGKAKLLDFGAAREVMAPEMGHVQSTEAILKHGFAPIEQYQRSGALGPWTDVYALSATVFYCLTGQIPPDAPKRIMDGVNIPWNEIPGLSAWQAEVMKKAMEPLPKNRTRSVEEVRTALFAGPISGEQPWIDHEPVPPEPKPEPTPDPRSVIHEIPNSGTSGKIPNSGTYGKTPDTGSSGQPAGQGGGKNQHPDVGGKGPGKKRPWVKIAAVAAAAAVVVVGAVMLLKGGKEAPKTPSNAAVQNVQKDSTDRPEPTINKNIPSQVDMAASFTGNPDHTITYGDGSRADIYMEGDREVARAIYDKDGALVYRFLADYDENGNMLYQLTFDPGNACVRADTYSYDEDGKLVTAAIILEDGQIYETRTYTYNANGKRKTVTFRDRNNKVTLSGEFHFEEGRERAVSYTAVYDDGSRYESTYDENGNTTSGITYDAEGKIEYWSEYLYDANGNNIRQTSRREDGKVRYTYEFEYDADGNQIGEISYDDVNAVMSRTKYTYQNGEQVCAEHTSTSGYKYAYHYMRDIDGNIVRAYDLNTYDYGYDYYTVWGDIGERVSYDNETGEVSSRSQYNYDENFKFLGYDYVYYSSYDGGYTQTEYDSEYREISSKSYDANGNLKTWTEPEYDENGNRVKSVTYNADGSIDSVDEWMYDEYGESLGARYTYYYDDGTYSVSEMDGDYNTISRTEYDANGYVTDISVYEYEYDEQGNKSKEYVYDGNGKLKYWTEYFYDAEGNYLDSQWHWE